MNNKQIFYWKFYVYSSSLFSSSNNFQSRFDFPLRFRNIASCFSFCSSISVIQHLFFPHTAKLSEHTIRVAFTEQQSSAIQHPSDGFLQADCTPLYEKKRQYLLIKKTLLNNYLLTIEIKIRKQKLVIARHSIAFFYKNLKYEKEPLFRSVKHCIYMYVIFA